METLKLWADFHVGQQMYAYDHFDVVERKRYWRPVSKTYLVCAWLRDLIRGMRDARSGGFQGWLYALSRMAGSPLRSSWGSTMKSRCCDD